MESFVYLPRYLWNDKAAERMQASNPVVQRAAAEMKHNFAHAKRAFEAGEVQRCARVASFASLGPTGPRSTVGLGRALVRRAALHNSPCKVHSISSTLYAAP